MAEIGSTLRETRIRKKIDIVTVEQATKIRTKYLRAIENEEWNVLPGPTYVKTFLRTYAQYLGIDAHMLVDEYTARFEEPEELEVPAFSREQPIRTRVQRAGPPSRLVLAGVLVLAFLALLLVLGLTAGDKGGKSATDRAGAASKAHQGAGGAGGAAQGGRRTNVRLEVVAARPVWVCVVDARNTRRVDARILQGGDHQGPFRSRSFKVTVGNGGGDLKIDGKLRDTPDTAIPVGYLVKPSGTSVLRGAERPTCR
jgi:hypothetical protein